MKISNCIYTILLIYSLQYNVLAASMTEVQYQPPNMFDTENNTIQNTFPENHLKRSEIREPYVDPNDRVDVERWNALIDVEIKKMPQTNDYSNETAASEWLQWAYSLVEKYDQVATELYWDYATNKTEENQQATVAQSLKRLTFRRLSLPIARKFNEHMKYSTNKDLKRIFLRLSYGTVNDDEKSVEKASKLQSELGKMFSTTEVCELNDKNKCHRLSPYLEQLMQTETDYDRLLWAWKGWHDNAGSQIRPLYLPYIDLLNKEAKENGYKDLADFWSRRYEMGNDAEFEDIVDQLLKDIMPLYTQLHAFVRGRLCELYPGKFDCNGPIPAHILGNMWAQEWQDRFEDLMPYPNEPLVNLTRALNYKHYTINKMYKTAEDFHTSINLYPMTPKFWARSIFTKPTDREVDCQPAAYDMGYHDDYRFKACTVVNENYFYTIHRLMGQLEYTMAYGKKQRYFYQGDTNTAFREAIGDTIELYAMSPAHLVKIGIIDQLIISRQYEINHLMSLALRKVVFLPFAYVMDKYRSALFRNQINRHDELNAKWWALRSHYSGIMPPVPRSDPENFDAGAKYHVLLNTPYFNHFIAEILKFQFYRGMCRLQEDTKELHMCDIYGNKHVGERWKEMLAMGTSKPWSEELKSLTGEDKLDSKAMLDFFEPLHKWLKTENLAKGYPVGWR